VKIMATDLAVAANDFSVAMAAGQHRALTLFVQRGAKPRRRAWKAVLATVGFGVVASGIVTIAVDRVRR
jgi:hypothetical protein